MISPSFNVQFQSILFIYFHIIGWMGAKKRHPVLILKMKGNQQTPIWLSIIHIHYIHANAVKDLE